MLNSSINLLVTDNVDCNRTVTLPSYGPFPFGTTALSLTTTDLSGNTASCDMVVSVTDPYPPRITCPTLSGLILYTDVGQDFASFSCVLGNGVEFNTMLCPGSAVSDNVGIQQLVQTPTGRFPIGPATLSFTAMDLAGNTNSCTVMNITVQNRTFGMYRQSSTLPGVGGWLDSLA